MHPAGEDDDHHSMDRGLHTIADDLSETWIEDWAGVGLRELEALLAKHAAFLDFVGETELEAS
jgi:hypothetical protein